MHWPKLANVIILIFTLGCAALACLAWWPQKGEEAAQPYRRPIIAGPALGAEIYPPIGTGCFALNRVMPEPKLPDLRGELAYVGANGRPDAPGQELYLSTKSGADPVRVSIGEPQYLQLQGEGFGFATSKTLLWVTPQSADDQTLALAVEMEVPGGGRVNEPTERSLITLSREEDRKGAVWQMGQTRVDSSLLARQRTRWFGQDLFLTEHGGDEYPCASGRERIDFGEGAGVYSCFIRPGDGLIWKDERWVFVPLGPESRAYPLLLLTKQEERSLHFELWDEAGRMKTPITILRSKDGWLPSQQKESLRFVAAKTWSQFVLEWGHERMPIRPGEWLLLDREGWRVLATPEEIVDYAAGQLTGELLVIEGLARSEGKHLLQGHLFNQARSDRIPFELPLSLEMRPDAVAPLACAKSIERVNDDPGGPLKVRTNQQREGNR